MDPGRPRGPLVGRMLVRRATDADAAAIRAVHAAAFARPGLIGAVPPEAVLVDGLRADGDLAINLVAVADDQVLGNVVCSPGALAGRRVLGLGPLGVLPAWQRQGVGHALVRSMLGAADALGEPAVVLLGEPAYYARFGFAPARNYGVTPQVAEWEPAFQLRPLTAWDPALRGEYRYAPAFDRL